MRLTTARSLAVLALTLAPVLAHAGIYKCASANGTVIFSDRPCETENGEKAATIKDAAGFSAVLARENARNVGRGCLALGSRIGQCGGRINGELASTVREHCRAPVTQLQRTWRSSRNSEDEQDYPGHRDLAPQDLRCDALQAESWDFVKANFSTKISQQDMKALEYNLTAVPSDGRPLNLEGRRRNRNP